jgi:hypothetical protein
MKSPGLEQGAFLAIRLAASGLPIYTPGFHIQQMSLFVGLLVFRTMFTVDCLAHSGSSSSTGSILGSETLSDVSLIVCSSRLAEGKIERSALARFSLRPYVSPVASDDALRYG